MSSPEDANYNCKDCESKFESIKELDEHMRKIHKPDLEQKSVSDMIRGKQIHEIMYNT